MPSFFAAACAFVRSREAIPRTITSFAFSMAGLTFSMPIRAVLTMPQTTGFMRALLNAEFWNGRSLGAGSRRVEMLDQVVEFGQNEVNDPGDLAVPLIASPDASPETVGLLNGWKLPAGISLAIETGTVDNDALLIE